jgi:long-chain acyl-CoA synthetase
VTNIPADIRSALQPYSLSDALKSHSARHPESVALLTSEQSLSYGELEQRVEEFAEVLRAVGIAEGTTVWSFLPRSFDFVVAFIALQRTNSTLVPFALDEDPGRIRHLSQRIPPSALVYSVTDEPRMRALAGALGVSMHEMRAPCRSARSQLICQPCQATELTLSPTLAVRGKGYLNFTSGTTDSSKAAVCTPDNLFWNTKAVVEGLTLIPEDTHLCTFPVHIHPHEIFARALYLGGAAVLMDFRELCADLAQLDRFGVTCLMSTPSLYDVLLRIQSAKCVKIRKLRLAESGGSVTPAALIKACHSQNGVCLTAVWGSAETSGVAMINPDPLTDPRALEALRPYYEAEVVGARGPAGIGELGELRLRGPGISPGYVNAAPSDYSPFSLGWYYTRDICRVVSNSAVVFEERKDEIIKSTGLAVFPAQVETVLRELEGVLDVAVFGFQHERKGEMLAAAVVRQTDKKPSIREIINFCRGRLPFFSIPQHIEFLDHLPYEAAGKLSRRLVRDIVRERVLQRRRSRPTDAEDSFSQ